MGFKEKVQPFLPSYKKFDFAWKWRSDLIKFEYFLYFSNFQRKVTQF